MKKTDTQIQTPTKWRITMQRTQWSPQEHSERRNPASNQWEFYRDDTGYGQQKCPGDTQEIPRQQK
jgi:hypothetical protein